MEKRPSTFMAWIVRMPLIKRWALMHCFKKENVSEHCHQTAVIAHLLAVISNKFFEGQVDADRVAVTALYHEISETKLQDLNSKTKYLNPEFTRQYKRLEHMAEEECLMTLPEELREEFRALVIQEAVPEECRKIVKAADTLAAYIKARDELRFNNAEFVKVRESFEPKLKQLSEELPEVRYFMEVFLESCSVTVDELTGVDSRDRA